MKYICPICKKELSTNVVKRHISNEHKSLLLIDKMYLYQNMIPESNSCKILYAVDIFMKYTAKNIFKDFEDYYKNIRWYKRSFDPFYITLSKYRKFKEEDLEVYFNEYIPYKKIVPKDCNSVKLASIYCTNEPENTMDFYNKVLKVRNAYTGHGAELSPWCKEFIGYKNLTNEEKEDIIISKTFNKKRNDFDKLNNSLTVQYYINKGLSEEEAKQALKERQTTFSLEKCIERYGEEKGKEVFNKRQEKWLSNFKKQNYSNISQELFWKIKKKIPNVKMYFATNDNDENNLKINKEYKCKLDISYVSLDFYIPSLNKWIEFDGDYWHGEARGNKERDRKREEAVFKAMPGIQLKRIKERDYKKYPEETVLECVEWILEK